MGIRWGLALVGGVLAEVGIFAVVIPVQQLFGERAFLLSATPACLAMTFVFGWWVARRAAARPLLHGLLVGVVAALIYLALVWGQDLPTEFVVANWLKLAGGLAGGAVAGRRLRRAGATA
jgi:putative membrane protein (TIGR04086 family)